jgi:nucleoside phosphorylase
MLVEVADNEREKAIGPVWLGGFGKNAPFVDGKPQYGPWDCSAFATLPGTHPAYRAPKPGEEFVDNPRVVRDGSGVVRAVAVPMKHRHGYYCGRGSDETKPFESLANVAATALAAAEDLQLHAFAADLTDIFRKPRGGVRYVFGDVPAAPSRFMSHGWMGGGAIFDNGVVIDVPISENNPDVRHWLLLLHRLGWRQISGSGLRADRFAWDQHTEVRLDMLLEDLSRLPDQFRNAFAGISKESFYSVIGTKEAGLDLNLASAFAIQILLADLAPILPVREKGVEDVDYSRESWQSLQIPELQTLTPGAASAISKPKLGIIVATDVEKAAVLKKLKPPTANARVLQLFHDKNTFYIGRLGQADVVVCMSAMGSVGRDASMMVSAEMIQTWQLAGIIMAGIAFGKDAVQQKIGNVLIADRIISYEPQRIGKVRNVDRGAEPAAGAVLLNRFRNIVGWSFAAPNGQICGFQVGPILSGEKLVDNNDFKQELFDRHPTAIGGEMEGAGVAAAADRNGCEWIVVKAICDWGDGTKASHHQEFAAASSVHLIEHVLNQPGALDALGRSHG